MRNFGQENHHRGCIPWEIQRFPRHHACLPALLAVRKPVFPASHRLAEEREMFCLCSILWHFIQLAVVIKRQVEESRDNSQVFASFRLCPEDL